jgi:hypothetical protein
LAEANRIVKPSFGRKELKELRHAAGIISFTAESPSGSRVTFWWSPEWNNPPIDPDKVDFEAMRLSNKVKP